MDVPPQYEAEGMITHSFRKNTLYNYSQQKKTLLIIIHLNK